MQYECLVLYNNNTSVLPVQNIWLPGLIQDSMKGLEYRISQWRVKYHGRCLFQPLLHFHIIRDEIKFWVTHVKVMGRAVSTFLLTHSNHNSDALAKYCIHTHTHANVHTTHYHISTSFFKRAREIILFTNITTAQFRFSKHKMSVTAYPLTYLKISCFHTFFQYIYIYKPSMSKLRI